MVLKTEKVLKVVLGEEATPTASTIADDDTIEVELQKYEDHVDKVIDRANRSI